MAPGAGKEVIFWILLWILLLLGSATFLCLTLGREKNILEAQGPVSVRLLQPDTREGQHPFQGRTVSIFPLKRAQVFMVRSEEGSCKGREFTRF